MKNKTAIATLETSVVPLIQSELQGAVNEIDNIRIKLAAGSGREYLDIKLYELTNRLFTCMDMLDKAPHVYRSIELPTGDQ